jgi:hypothetical protein
VAARAADGGRSAEAVHRQALSPINFSFFFGGDEIYYVDVCL